MTAQPPAQPPPAPQPARRPRPPMFARQTGQGHYCGLCVHRTGRRTTKAVLPGGIEVCPKCDAP